MSFTTVTACHDQPLLATARQIFRICKGLQKPLIYTVKTVVNLQTWQKWRPGQPWLRWPRPAGGQEKQTQNTSTLSSYRISASRSFDFVDFPFGAAEGSSQSHEHVTRDAFWSTNYSTSQRTQLASRRCVKLQDVTFPLP